jgi:CDP-diacylglycerol--glycerol-3-phosphate 3-phosphatidyltransferase
MNLANKLTIFRIILVPFFVAALMIQSIPYNLTIAFAVFAIASITDFLDGYIARSRNQITDLGKFLDPIADKILVMAALVCFAGLGWIQAWVVVVILARDFIVGAIRLAAVESESKIVIPARTSGKVKTLVTMICICGIMILWALALDFSIITYEAEIFSQSDSFLTLTTINDPALILRPIGNAVMYGCAALTVFSGWQYAWDFRNILKMSKNNKKNKRKRK